MRALITRHTDPDGKPCFRIEGVHHTMEEVLCRHAEREIEVEIDLEPHPEPKRHHSAEHGVARVRLQALPPR